jgi:hypothetical protein
MPKKQNASFASIRKTAGDHDLLIIAIVAILLVGGLIFLALHMLGQSEEHVEKVRETKIPYKESLQWRDENLRSAERLKSDLASDPNRTEADYGDMNLDDDCMQLIGRMSRLQKLALTRAVFKDVSLRHLTRLPLHKLGLQGATITNKAIPYILEIGSLSDLDIGDTDVDDDGLKLLSQSKTIKRLVLTLGRCFSNEGINFISEMPNLTELEIGRAKHVDADCLKSLSKANGLIRLNIEGIAFNDDTASHLKNLTNLRHLQFSMCRLKDSDLAEIATMTSLRTITFFGEDVTDQGLIELARSSHIRGIFVKRCLNVTADGIKQIEQISPKCKVTYIPARRFSENRSRPEIDLLESTMSAPDD